MKNFNQKYGPWALITGASSGIGESFASQLAAKGLNLALVARRKDRLDALAQKLEKRFHIETKTIGVDLLHQDFLEPIKQVTDDLQIGLLVNNAGLWKMNSYIETSLEDEFNMIDLNIKAPSILTHHFAKKMKPKILITGATGTTGQYAIQALMEKGADLRAMVKTIDDRSKSLEELGVEVVQADFLDLHGLRKALNGVNRAYFVYPFMDHLPKAAGYFAKVAKEQNIELVVSMSQMNVHEGTNSPASQNHLIAEDILDWANVGAVHIRPALFAWNYLGMAAPTVVSEKKFYFPNPEAKYTIVHPQGIGEVVAEILTDENIQQHIGQRYELSGSRIYNGSEVADEIGKLLNQTIEYVPIPVEMWIEAMKNVPTVNAFLATHLKEFSRDIALGKFNKTTDVVKNMTGHEPRSFEEYLTEHKDVFLN
ncbi:MAG: SDR family NAD(P)-dependent oxidoreductase [bacterium]